MEYNGKDFKKTNADKTQQGSNRWAGPMQSSVFLFVCFSFFFFFFLSFFPLFVPRLVIRRMRKGVVGIGGGERGKREKRRKKREKKREGGGRREKSVKFCFFFFFFFFYVLCGILQTNAHNSQRHDKRTTPTSFSRHYQTNLLM